MTIALSMLPLLSLCGCGDKDPQPEAITATAEDITSASINYTDMARTSAYGFILDDKDGNILFSCNYFIDDGGEFEEVTMENVPVDSTYMDELRELVKKHGFLGMSYRDPNAIDTEIRDAPMCSLTLRWPQTIDGRTSSGSLRLNYFPSGTSEVEKLFRELAEIYTGQTAATKQ